MKDPISKKLIKGKIMIGTIIFLIVIGTVLITMSSLFEDYSYDTIGMMALIISFYLLVIYLSGLRLCKCAVKDLEKRGIYYHNLIRDIDFDEYTSRSLKFYIGEKAIYFKKPGIVLDYDAIAWIYIKKTKVYGFINISEEFVICTITGRSYTVRVNKEGFIEMLKDNSYRFAPYLMIGYTSENSEKYNALVEAYSQLIKEESK